MAESGVLIFQPNTTVADAIELLTAEPIQVGAIKLATGEAIALSLRALLQISDIAREPMLQMPLDQVAALFGRPLPDLGQDRGMVAIAPGGDRPLMDEEVLAGFAGPPVANYLRCSKNRSHRYSDDGARTTCFICGGNLVRVTV